MRRTSPCTRIMGGRPDDKCRSDALFFTTKASSSVRSITIPPGAREQFFLADSGHYGNNRGQPASCKKSHPARGGGGRTRSRDGVAARGFEDASGRARRGSGGSG